jgi:hypothetical protein
MSQKLNTTYKNTRAGNMSASKITEMNEVFLDASSGRGFIERQDECLGRKHRV